MFNLGYDAASLNGALAYAKQLEEITGIARLVFEVPEGSYGYEMGYRFSVIKMSEMNSYAKEGILKFYETKERP